MADKKISELTNITGANLADADEFVVVDTSASETKAITRSELGLGINKLGYNGTQKIITTSTGVDVTGTVTADGLTVDGNASLFSGGATRTLTLGPSGAGIEYNVDGTTTFQGRTDAYPVEFDTNSTRRMRLDSNGDISFYEDTGTTPKFFWDASAERLGIGEASPATDLHISNSGATQLLLESGNTSQGILLFGDAEDLNVGSLTYDHSDNSMRFETNDTERMRIDASGNLLVGKTSANTYNTTAGFETRPDGLTSSTRDGAISLILNRLTSDGAIADFRKDGTTVGSIGVSSGVIPYFVRSSGSVGGIALGGGATKKVFPCDTTGAGADNAMDLGDTATRFKDLYLSGGVRNVNSDGINFGTSGGEPNIVPVNGGTQVDGQGSIGTSTNRWKDLYLSGGVYLGGTGAANKLDDYEEGTWTPVIDPGVIYSGTLTLSGNYTKIGRLVWINFRVVVSGGSISVGTGGQLVTGIPFAVATDNVGGYGAGQNNATGATITPYAYTNAVTMSAAATTSNGFYATITYTAA